MTQYTLICVPYSYPDLTYGGPTISSESLRRILTKDLGHHCRVLSFQDTQNFGSSLLGTHKGNILFQFLYIIYFSARFHHKNKTIILNSFFHIQSILIYCFIKSFMIAAPSIKLQLLIAPRAELMDRGQRNQNGKEYAKRLIFIIFTFLESISRNTTKLAFTSINEVDNVSSFYKRRINVCKIHNIILPNVPNDILPHSLPKLNLDLTYLQRFSHYKDTQTISLCYLGRLSPEKGLSELIDILSLVARTQQKIVLNLIGPVSRSYEQAISYSISQHTNTSFQVDLKGMITRDNLLSCLNDNLFAIYPSKGENYCHALAECLSIGLPVIYQNITYWSKYHSCISLDAQPQALYDYKENSCLLRMYLTSFKTVDSYRYVDACRIARSIFDTEVATSSSYLLDHFTSFNL